MTREIDFKIKIENKDANNALDTVEKLEQKLADLKSSASKLDIGSAQFKKAQKEIQEVTDELIDVGAAAAASNKDLDAFKDNLGKAGKDASKSKEQIKDLSGEVKNTGKEASSMGDSFDLAGGKIDEVSGGAVSGLMSIFTATKTAVVGMNALKVAVAATGIGLLVIAVVALTQAFSRSSEGSDTLTRIMGQLSVVTNVILDLFADLGELIISVFEDPQKALNALGDFLKKQLINRVEGLLELIPALGSALVKLFSGDFSGAAEEAANAFGKAALGVEDITTKLTDLRKGTAEYAAELKALSDRQAQADNKNIKAKELEIELLEKRATTESEIEKLRNKVADELGISAEERIQALQAIADKQNSLNNLELEASKLRSDALLLQAKGTKLTDEERTAIAEAKAEVIAFQGERNRIETERLDGERGFRVEALAREKEFNEARLDAYRNTEDNIIAATAARIANEQLALERELQDVINNEELKGKAKLDAVAAAAEAIVANEKEALEEQLKANAISLDRQIADTLSNTTLIDSEKRDLIESLRATAEQEDIAAEAEYNNRLLDREKQAILDRNSAITEFEAALAEARAAGVQFEEPEPAANDFGAQLQKAREESEALLEQQLESDATQREIQKAKLDADLIDQQEYEEELQRIKTNSAGVQKQIADDLANQEGGIREREIESYIELTRQGFQNVQIIAEAFGKKGEEIARAAFEAQKVVNIATTLIDTYKSAVSSYASLSGIPVVGPALGGLAAGAAVVSGIEQVNRIRKTQYNSTNVDTSPTPTPNISSGALPTTGEPSTPNFSLFGTGGNTNIGEDLENSNGTNPQVIQAFVSETDLSSTNRRLDTIRQQSEL